MTLITMAINSTRISQMNVYSTIINILFYYILYDNGEWWYNNI